MNNKFVSFLTFVIGATVGSVATWQYVKKKYEQIAQNEIDSVKEVFSKKDLNPVNETDDIRNKANQAKEKLGIVEYAARLQGHGYTNYSNMEANVKNTANKKEEESELMAVDKPYVIEPEEFGEIDEYERIGLTYYSDNILADDNDELVEDVDTIVGVDSLSHFGEFEEDSVFVRNDRLKCDYEILLDQRRYSDVVKRKPHQMED